MAENIAEQTDSNETSINWEERAKKAEAKIVDLKKQDEPKAEPEKKEGFNKDDLDKAIKEALKEQAIQSQEEQYKQNIDETNSSSIWTEDAATTEQFQVVWANDYLKMSQREKDDYRKNCLDNLGELVVN